jgi:hypothetical protein
MHTIVDHSLVTGLNGNVVVHLNHNIAPQREHSKGQPTPKGTP